MSKYFRSMSAKIVKYLCDPTALPNKVIDRDGMVQLAKALKEVERNETKIKDFTFETVDLETGVVRERTSSLKTDSL